MALDRYFGENLNVKTLNARPFEREKPTEARLSYKRWKNSGLYDTKRMQWSDGTDEGGRKISASRDSKSNLTGILAEALFDKKNAKKIFDKLKKTQLYDGDWRYSIHKNQERRGPLDINASTQLLGILVESVYDKKKAKSLFENLKRTNLYASALNRWMEITERIGGELAITDRAFYSEPQLIGILVESLFDKEKAREMFEDLRKSKFFDSKTGQWTRCLCDDPSLSGTFMDERESQTQLIAILVEAEFDIGRAKEAYETLKKSSLYDASNEKWRDNITGDQFVLETLNYSTYPQLLDILVQYKLQEKSKKNFRQENKPPETRKF